MCLSGYNFNKVGFSIVSKMKMSSGSHSLTNLVMIGEAWKFFITATLHSSHSVPSPIIFTGHILIGTAQSPFAGFQKFHTFHEEFTRNIGLTFETFLNFVFCILTTIALFFFQLLPIHVSYCSKARDTRHNRYIIHANSTGCNSFVDFPLA